MKAQAKQLDEKRVAELAREAGITLPAMPKQPAKLAPAAEAAAIQAISEVPSDEVRWTAYATLLAQAGDPLGRLALVGRARAALRAQERAVLDKYAGALLGPLAPWVANGWLQLTWVDGYIDAVDIDIRDRIAVTGAEVVNALLDHPSGGRLREIRFSGNATPGAWQDDPQELIDALVAKRPASLRELSVSGVFGSPCGDVSAVWSAFPELTYFDAFGSSVTVGTIDAPKLEVLRFNVRAFTGENIAALEQANLPKLRVLRVAYVEAKVKKSLTAKLKQKFGKIEMVVE